MLYSNIVKDINMYFQFLKTLFADIAFLVLLPVLPFFVNDEYRLTSILSCYNPENDGQLMNIDNTWQWRYYLPTILCLYFSVLNELLEQPSLLAKYGYFTE